MSKSIHQYSVHVEGFSCANYDIKAADEDEAEKRAIALFKHFYGCNFDDINVDMTEENVDEDDTFEEAERAAERESLGNNWW